MVVAAAARMMMIVMAVSVIMVVVTARAVHVWRLQLLSAVLIVGHWAHVYAVGVGHELSDSPDA